MRLVREAVGEESVMKGKRHLFRIYGKESQADLIEKIDIAIGKELTGNKCWSEYNQSYIDETYHLNASDWCADYHEGTGCGWCVEIDMIHHFKSLWKKHKKLLSKKE